jgi:hypothetical protein
MVELWINFDVVIFFCEIYACNFFVTKGCPFFMNVHVEYFDGLFPFLNVAKHGVYESEVLLIRISINATS